MRSRDRFRAINVAKGTKEDDIREVMAEEKGRGKRRFNAEAGKLDRERLPTMRVILGLREKRM
jgi:hypothetical protein